MIKIIRGNKNLLDYRRDYRNIQNENMKNLGLIGMS